MKEVDARGLSCPEPLMLASEALDRYKNEEVRVLVTEPHQKMNVEKLAKTRGRKTTSTQTEEGFVVVVEAC